MGPPANGSAQKNVVPPATGSAKKKSDRQKHATGNGSSKKRKIAKKKRRVGGKFVKKEPLPSDFPQLQAKPARKQKPARKRLPRKCDVSTRDDSSEALCVNCCKSTSDLQFETTTNQLYCGDCLDVLNPSKAWFENESEDDTAAFEDGDVDGGDDACGDAVTWQEVFNQLMANTGLETVASTSGGKSETYGRVSKGNEKGSWVAESVAIKKDADKKRKPLEKIKLLRRQRAEAAANNNSNMKTFFSPAPKIAIDDDADNVAELDAELLDPGFQEVSAVLDDDEDNDAGLDAAATEALQDVMGDLAANVGPHPDSNPKCELTTRQRLCAHMACMKKTRNPDGFLKAAACLKFEGHVRGGINDAVSELVAARLVAVEFYVKERQARVNASKNEHNKRHWYRHRARAILCGYRFFQRTGTILPDKRGRCQGKSHIHDPDVQRWAKVVIQSIGKGGRSWSARTFRDKMSVRLQAAGLVTPGKKIGRSTTTYYLHILGLHLACPKKGIYKDGHERVDTVAARKVYTAKLRSFRDRERTYEGDRLEREIFRDPRVSRLPEAVRVYHDECIYAPHEGSIQLWVKDGEDPLYKKPRGQVVMCSGFICRCHGMMQVPAAEVHEFLRWTSAKQGRIFTVEEDFPQSSKIYKDFAGVNCGDLCSFTTIVPGKASGKDDYWVNADVCAHTIEVSRIFDWVHRRPHLDETCQPEAYFIFDGSSNHGARAPDSLHVGKGVNKGPGGKNAPGSPPTPDNPNGLPQMRDGWCVDEKGQRVTQSMHRQ
jgi:hypothetical protein